MNTQDTIPAPSPFANTPPKTHAMTLDDIKCAIRTDGGHWFSRDTMRWHGTLIKNPKVYSAGDLHYFITKDYTGFDRTERRWTIRAYSSERRSVLTVGGLAVWNTRADAVDAMWDLISAGAVDAR